MKEFKTVAAGLALCGGIVVGAALLDTTPMPVGVAYCTDHPTRGFQIVDSSTGSTLRYGINTHFVQAAEPGKGPVCEQRDREDSRYYHYLGLDQTAAEGVTAPRNVSTPSP